MNPSQSVKYLLICFGLTQNVLAEADDDLGLIYGSDQMQSIASGHPLPQSLSPSVTSVLTSQDIDRIGARRLTDVLEYLPGVHISSARNGSNVIGFRGIASESNSQVLILSMAFLYETHCLGENHLSGICRSRTFLISR